MSAPVVCFGVLLEYPNQAHNSCAVESVPEDAWAHFWDLVDHRPEHATRVTILRFEDGTAEAVNTRTWSS